MEEIRLLFTGVGRRIELIQAFRDAAFCMNMAIKIYGADMEGTAPALAYCDYSRMICSMRSENYISELVNICHQDKIDVVIPTIDTDLLILSKNVSKFGATKVLISDADKIAICRDKNLTAAFFESCGCLAPKTVSDWEAYDGSFPCFIKPKDGSSSINAFKVDTREALERYAVQLGDYIVQPFIDGIEYTVDAFCDFNGAPVHITPRIRSQVRAGEVLKTQISMDEQIIDESKRIIEQFKPVGPITIQLIRQKSTGQDFFIEINPRYGGGAPLSIKAGANSAKTLLKLLIEDSSIECATISDGAIFSRFDQSVCLNNGCSSTPIKGIIFDLDDTLYSEKDYVKSGFVAVEEYLGITGAAEEMWKLFENAEPAIDCYLEMHGLIYLKDACLHVYRDHTPNIVLEDEIRLLICSLRDKGLKLGIITDGRPTGQRRKIEALGLDCLVDDIIVTDEIGGEQFRKPCDIAFRIMQRKWRLPFAELIYLGDNLSKDFQAPRQLGMQYRLIDNGNGLHYSSGIGITLLSFLKKLLAKT